MIYIYFQYLKIDNSINRTSPLTLFYESTRSGTTTMYRPTRVRIYTNCTAWYSTMVWASQENEQSVHKQEYWKNVQVNVYEFKRWTKKSEILTYGFWSNVTGWLGIMKPMSKVQSQEWIYVTFQRCVNDNGRRLYLKFTYTRLPRAVLGLSLPLIIFFMFISYLNPISFFFSHD